MMGLIRDPRAADQVLVELRQRLDRFYSTTTDYTAFQATESRDELYALLDPALDEIKNRSGTVRVLELGAGRTGFPVYLKKRALPVQFTAQDVTASNEDYLRQHCQAVHIGDIAQIQEQFDLIISTFVLEHVSAPREFLQHVRRLLAPSGYHVVFCPRYDVPGYVCPSLRHLSKPNQLLVSTALTASRLLTRLDRRPRFWVNADPSMFHGPWYRDADAVHLVGRYDIEQWHRNNGFEVTRLRPPCRGVRDWLLKRWLTLNLLCRLRS
jgi:SAM-dependent methyltransferase